MSDTPRAATFDPTKVDLPSFLAGLKAIREDIDASIGEADAAHLRRTERIGKAATLVGLATSWIVPNPISAVGFGLGRSTRWLLMHHIAHRGYDRVPGMPVRRTSKGFAKGRRRFVDWLDVMHPEAWTYEHNVLHHSHTGEEADPDLIERNATFIHGLPVWQRWVMLVLLAVTWRASYYAPSTLDVWRAKREALRREDSKPLPPRWLELWGRCYLPYFLFHFVVLPAPFLLISKWAALSVLVNSLLGEILTNLHTFAVVGPNHTGEDVYRFARAPKDKAERMLFQVVGSVNFATGNEWVDYGQLWLNYQIEHHIYPDVPMLQYRRIQPQVRALCEAHGVPYLQESVWTRIWKMSQVVVGRTRMIPYETVESPREVLAA